MRVEPHLAILGKGIVDTTGGLVQLLGRCCRCEGFEIRIQGQSNLVIGHSAANAAMFLRSCVVQALSRVHGPCLSFHSSA